MSEAGAGELAAAVASRAVTARELVEAAERRARAAAALNALAVDRFEAALGEAARLDGEGRHGPLAGVPVTVKESLWVRGTPACAGIARLAAARSRADGAVAAALRRAGAVLVGKGNVAQALWYAESDNPVYGRTLNPWDAGRTPGGSSGGDAALVAAGVVPVAVGTDVGGSVRTPAAWCGVFALKPTAGRWSTRGSRDDALFVGVPVANAPGVLARSVDDLRLVAGVLDAGAPGRQGGPPPAPPRAPLRVGVVATNGLLDPAPPVARAVREAAGALERSGVVVVDFAIPGAAEARALFDAAFQLDGGRRLRRLVADGPAHPRLAEALRAAPAGARDAAGRRALVAAIERYRADFAGALDALALDALVGPVHALAAVPHGASGGVVAGQAYTSLVNLLGLPAGVAPVTRVRPGEESGPRGGAAGASRARAAEAGSAGLPVAVQVVARAWREDVVLALLECVSGH